MESYYPDHTELKKKTLKIKKTNNHLKIGRGTEWKISRRIQMTQKHFKRCSTSLATREIQIKSNLRLHLKPSECSSSGIQMITNAGLNGVQGESLYPVGGSANEHSHYESQPGGFLSSTNRTA